MSKLHWGILLQRHWCVDLDILTETFKDLLTFHFVPKLFRHGVCGDYFILYTNISFDISLGLTAVAGPCDAGYYCPESSRQRDELECPMGFWCPVQTHYPQQCENGTFSNATGSVFNMTFINISRSLCVTTS